MSSVVQFIFLPRPPHFNETKDSAGGEIDYNKIEHAYSIDSFKIFSIEQHRLTSIFSIFLGFFRSRLNATIKFQISLKASF